MSKKRDKDRMSNLGKPNYVRLFGGDDVPMPVVQPNIVGEEALKQAITKIVKPIPNYPDGRYKEKR